jgi:predicted RND superfamily exporter protein
MGSTFFIKKSVGPFDLLDTISKKNPIYKDFKEFQKKYGNEEVLVVALNFKKKFLNSKSALLEIESLTNSLKNISPSLKVRSLTSSSYYSLSKGLFKTQSFFTKEKTKIKLPLKIFKSPLYKNIFWDEKQKIALIYIQGQKDQDALKKAINFVQKLKKTKKTLYIFGHSYFKQVVRQESINDQKKFIPLFIFITFLFFFLLFKSIKVGLAALYIISISYLSTLNFIILIEKTISPFGSLALLISCTMAISDLIHYFYFFNRPKSVRVVTPCFYTSLTTAIGFLSLCISQIKPVSNFGIFGAFAVFISFGSTFCLLPFITKYFKITPHKEPLLGNFQNSLYSFCVKNKFGIIVVFVFSGLFFTSQIKNLKFEDNFLNHFKKEHPFSKSSNFFRKNIHYSGTLDLILIKKREFFLSPEFMPFEREIKKELLTHPSISRVQSALDIKEDLLLRSTLSKENIKILDFFLFFDKLIPEDTDEYRFIITLKDQSSIELKSIFEFIHQTFKKGKYSTLFDIKISGYSKVRFQVMTFLFQTFYGGLILSFSGIFLSFLFLFRSFKLSLIGLIPNILPIVFVSGMSGLLGISMNFYLVILNGIVLGISVDDTIHFLYHFKKHQGDLKSFLHLISPPLIMTTVLLCLIFPCFYLSSFISFAHISLFLTFSFIIALLADLTVLPTLFLIKNKRP